MTSTDRQETSCKVQHCIPVIDLFAGPGGLAEGFAAFRSAGSNPFRISLAVEKDLHAHRTLELRRFYRQFPDGQAPDEYYAYLRGEIARDELFFHYPAEAGTAASEVWQAELGADDLSDAVVDEKIERALSGAKRWILIGGPPCQAYSTVGRARNKGKQGYVPEKDNRHFLYRHYLQIIARHRPTVFILENVRGLLSAKVNGSRIFERLLEDLHDPFASSTGLRACVSGCNYRIHSLTKPACFPADSSRSEFSPTDFLIRCEDYGIPQSRHRVILLGIREDANDTNIWPETLVPQGRVEAAAVLDDLPKIRSGLSREEDTSDNWAERIFEIVDNPLFKEIYNEHDWKVWDRISMALVGLRVTAEYGRGKDFLPCHTMSKYRNDWYYDPRLGGICNHTSKAHMPSDLHRYLFASCFAVVHGRSPALHEFPPNLWPDHKNAYLTKQFTAFQDRFRVQLSSKPSTTVMSHIAKDGHYYIHYDPAQCRSLTVREAARLQTFPDSYFFEGNKTQQYTQVGNAVPPLLAMQIASIVNKLLLGIK